MLCGCGQPSPLQTTSTVTPDFAGTLVRPIRVYLPPYLSTYGNLCLAPSPTAADVKSVVWHPARDELVSTSYDETVRVWAPDEEDEWGSTPLPTASAHGDTIWFAAFERARVCAGGADAAGPGVARTQPMLEYAPRLATAGNDGALVVWTEGPAGWRVSQQFTELHTRAVYHCDWRGFIVTAGGDDGVCILGPAAAETVTEDTAAADAAAFASETSATAEDVAVLEQVDSHPDEVNCAVWNPVVRRVFATACDDGVVRLWRYDPY